MKTTLLTVTSLLFAMVQGAHADSLSILKCREALHVENTAGMIVQITKSAAPLSDCGSEGCIMPYANGLKATVLEVIPGAFHTFGEFPVNQVNDRDGSRYVSLPGGFELTLDQPSATQNDGTIPSHLSAEDEAGRKIDVNLVCTFAK